MSKPQDIIESLVTLLKNDNDLRQYIDQRVYKGIRDNTINFPYIVIEPINMLEIDDTYPMQKMRMSLFVAGFFKTIDPDNQIDELYRFENMVKKAIGADRRLGETVIHIEMSQSAYEFALWPVRNFSIEVGIQFEQDSRTRT